MDGANNINGTPKKHINLKIAEVKMHKQNVDSNEYFKFSTEELLSIFKEEAQHICNRHNEIHSISESTLNDFIKCHGKYVRFT